MTATAVEKSAETDGGSLLLVVDRCGSADRSGYWVCDAKPHPWRPAEHYYVKA
jgi:hypothetical protein